VCDGCGTILTTRAGLRTAITGSRMDGLSGGELPDDEFDWCRSCALVAFRAVKAAQEAHLNVINSERTK
jgi:hypothetical protein